MHPVSAANIGDVGVAARKPRALDQPGAFPLRGTDRAEDHRPIRCAGRGAPAGACHANLAHRRVSLFFWPMRASSCTTALSRRLSVSLARIFASSAGKFFYGKASTASSFCVVVARPRRDLGEAERLQLAPDRGLVERDGERLQEPPLAKQPCAACARRRPTAGTGPASTNLRQCAAGDRRFRFECAPGDFVIDQPASGPLWALKRSTQSLNASADHGAADPRRIRPAATIVDLGQRQQTTALGRVPGPLREAPQ